MRDQELFYIVGVGRSGTTLLMSMLNAHPEIGTPPETHFVTNHLLKSDRVSFSQCRAALLADQRVARLGLGVDEILEPFRSDSPVMLAGVYFRILELWKRAHQVRLVGDKAPKYVQHLPLLHAIAPGAKVIHLIRDPRAVYLSRRKAAWSAGHPRWRHLLAYAVQYAEGRERGPALFGDDYREVLYERLIAEPERELAALCAFLGVEYDRRMLQFFESAPTIIADDEWEWKQEAAGPLLTQNAEKWRSELSEREIALVESACRQAFKDGLYLPSDDSVSAGSRSFGLLIRILAEVYRRLLRAPVRPTR